MRPQGIEVPEDGDVGERVAGLSGPGIVLLSRSLMSACRSMIGLETGYEK